MLDSKVADTNNVSQGGFAGSITAALFLRRFTTEAKAWLHCDIYAWNQIDRGRAGRKAPNARRRARSMRCWSKRYG